MNMFSTLMLCAWIVLWILFGAAHTSNKDGDALVRAIGTLLPGFAATTCLFYFAVFSERGATPRAIALWVHHASFFALLAFLMAAQFLQVEGWWKIRCARSISSIAATYRRMWLITALLPGPIAITIFMTGLYLIWEEPQENSPTHVWLMLVIFLFGFFFFDGLLGFAPIVRRWRNHWEEAAINRSQATGARQPSLWESSQIFIHLASWPSLFWLGLSRYDIANPISNWGELAKQRLRFLPLGVPDIILALAIWLFAGAIVIFVRRNASRTSAFMSRLRVRWESVIPQ